MSTAGRSRESTPGASDVAAACRDAELVRLLATADGDALAATGLLARALSETGVAFQASVTRGRRVDGETTEADATVTVGASGGDVALTAVPASPVAHAAGRELGADPDPVLALAGVTAAGGVPGEFPHLLEAAEASGVERRPGVAVPTDDVADGLAHTTLAHAPFSGDPEAARAALADLDDTDGRRVASLLALATAGDAPPRAAEAVERALRPYAPGGPFATVGGYADVIDAVARERPGTGLALVLGHGGREGALAAWRDHARRAHGALRAADTGRYDGLVVARVEPPSPVGTVARLLRDFRSPEPVALAVSGVEAGAAAVDRDVESALRDAAAAVGGEPAGREAGGREANEGNAVEVVARGTTGYARGIDDQQAFIAAFRGAL